MTVLRSVRPRSTDSGSTVLQHFYVIAAIVVLFALFILRIIVLRRRNRAFSEFFRLGGNSPYPYGSYPPYDSNHDSMIHGIQLTRPPAAYQPNRRVHAADVDAHGRRLDSGGEEWEGKDTLPAYDSHDRPPKYVEAGWSPSSPAEHSAAGAQSGMTHPNTANGISRDIVGQPLDDTRAVAGMVRESEAPPPHPIQNDSSHS